MSRAVATKSLYEALVAEGFQLPDECADIKLCMPVNGVFKLRYEVFIRDEDLAKLGRALERCAGEEYMVPRVSAPTRKTRRIRA